MTRRGAAAKPWLSGQQAKLVGSSLALLLMFVITAAYTRNWDPRQGGLEGAVTVIMIALVDRLAAGGAPTEPPEPSPGPPPDPAA